MSRVLCRLLKSFQALSSLSAASVRSAEAERSRSAESVRSAEAARSRSAEAERSRSLASAAARQSSLESVLSVRSKSIESAASVASVEGKQFTTPTFNDSPTATNGGTDNVNGIGSGDGSGGGNNDKSNSNNNVALVGGAVGGVLGATVLGLIGLFLWRRTRGAPTSPPAGQQPFYGQQSSPQPVTPTSPTFSANSNYIGGPPVTFATPPGWNPQRSSLLAQSGAGASATDQASTRSQQPDPPLTVNTWVDRPPTNYQETYERPASLSRSVASEGPVDPRQLYSDALRGSAYSPVSPIDVPPSPSGASGNALHQAPTYAPPSKLDAEKF
jgi:hypothetical protein